ncbi:MAG: DUF1349 domain-containing protein [Alphaproteobacteria bacterium]
MLLQHLRNFEWLNEPLGVFFIDSGMKVVANSDTAFFQDKNANISIDNGHLFFMEREGNFCLKVKWKTEVSSPKAEAGIMIRIDSKNWVKVFTSQNKNNLADIYAHVTNMGSFDQSFEAADLEDIWLQIERRENTFIISYSKDNKTYKKIRIFSFIQSSQKIKAGAYICNPQNTDFESVLNYIDIL